MRAALRPRPVDRLAIRRDHPLLFSLGDYEPVTVVGPHADCAAAFRRRHEADEIVVVVPRQIAKLGCPPLGLLWDETTVALPDSAAEWRDLLTWRQFAGGRALPLAELLSEMPLAVLFALKG
jgi:(1->4)-alpha-D-glucan 1-alpha-D-glucosylmutase